MALLSEDKRKEIFKALKLGEYNKANIKALQSKYLARKSDADGIYGTNTDNLLRHLYNCHKYLNRDNFKPQEFKCECGGKYCCGYPTYMKPAQLTNLQAIRNKYKKPMTITSGMRCKGYNNAIGGSIANSKHLLGQATDFYMQGVTDTLANRKNFIKYAKGLPNTTYIYGNGINIYGNSVSAPYMGNAIHYDTNDGNPTPVQDEVKGTSNLAVDGIGGTDTVKRMQEFFGTTQDGVITGQLASQNKYYPSLIAVKNGKGGSACIKNLQRWVGTTQDGVLGQTTVKMWQKKLGVTADGIFSTASMKAWQKYLNENDKPVYPSTKPATTTKPSVAIKTNAEKINEKAIDYAWIAGTPEKVYKYPDGNPNPAFKEAWKKYFPKQKINCGCHQFVMLVLKACGYPTMDISSWTKILAYLKKNFTELKVNYTQAQLRAGDIRVHKNAEGGYHIWIIAKDPSGKMVRKEANQVGNKRYAHTNTSNSGNTKKHKQDWLFRAK